MGSNHIIYWSSGSIQFQSWFDVILGVAIYQYSLIEQLDWSEIYIYIYIYVYIDMILKSCCLGSHNHVKWVAPVHIHRCTCVCVINRNFEMELVYNFHNNAHNSLLKFLQNDHKFIMETTDCSLGNWNWYSTVDVFSVLIHIWFVFYFRGTVIRNNLEVGKKTSGIHFLNNAWMTKEIHKHAPNPISKKYLYWYGLIYAIKWIK